MKGTLFVRLKPHDPRRGQVLRRYTYLGIKFQVERGWYRVEKEVAEYLRGVRQVTADRHAPLAFDVCTEDEAKVIDDKEKADADRRRAPGDGIKLSAARSGVGTTKDEDGDDRSGRRPRK